MRSEYGALIVYEPPALRTAPTKDLDLCDLIADALDADALLDCYEEREETRGSADR